MTPELVRLIAEIAEAIGPIIVQVVAWLFDGKDPIAELAAKRVSDVWPEVESARALAFRTVEARLPELRREVEYSRAMWAPA